MATTYPASKHDLPNPSPGTPTTDATIPHAQQHTNLADLIEAIQDKLGYGSSGQVPAVDTVLRAISATGTQYGKIFNAQVDPAASIAKSKLNLTGSIGSADLDVLAMSGLLSANPIMNGDMVVAQQGGGPITDQAGGTPSILIDRWQTANNGCGTTTVQRGNGPIIANGMPSYFASLHVIQTAAATPAGSSYHRVYQAIDGNMWNPCRDQTCTLSFWVYASHPGIYSATLDLRGSGNQTCVMEYTVNVSSTWEKKVITFPTPPSGKAGVGNAISTYLGFQLSAGPSMRQAPGSWVNGSVLWSSTNQMNVSQNASAYWLITGVRIAPGTVEAPDQIESYALAELACRRYRQVIYPGVSGYGGLGSGVVISTTQADIAWPLVPRMRGTPTLLFSGQSGHFEVLSWWGSAYQSKAVTSIATSAYITSNQDQIGITPVCSSAGMVGGSGAVMRSVSTNGWIETRAEPG